MNKNIKSARQSLRVMVKFTFLCPVVKIRLDFINHIAILGI